ncbi:hypothetical protein [Thiothrix subterranea]|uniref:hypothetical protein n=1 Tax=Thiothrix subterranea TaxID=2735563 RepID=UPI00280BD46A|nr:hypothetical protein [Thiothrix subterranea]
MGNSTGTTGGLSGPSIPPVARRRSDRRLPLCAERVPRLLIPPEAACGLPSSRYCVAVPGGKVSDVCCCTLNKPLAAGVYRLQPTLEASSAIAGCGLT